MFVLTLAACPALAARAAAGAEMQGSQVVSWGRVEVVAPPQLVFAVLTDYDRMARFLPGMVASRVVDRDAKAVVVEQTADVGVLLFKQRVTVRLAIEESAPYRLAIRSLGGSFKELTGLYVLTRRQDHTLIEYNSRFIPAFDLPPMLGMYAVQHSLERHLDGLAAEIRRRSAAPQPPAPSAIRGE
jgi:ribosome-associated toxin RatA of RatAB toxin-antitoxin module